MDKRRFLCGLLIFLFASAIHAQVTRQTGTIRGVVADEGGEPLPGVSVVATSPALIGKVTDLTAKDGSFRLPALSPGTYAVLAELSGFGTVRQESIVVRVGQVISINVKMAPVSLQEEVTVVASPPLVDVQSLKIVTRIDAESLARLPLSRRFGNIVAMTPGIIEDFNEKMTGMSTGVMHGGTAYSNAFEVDGVNVNDPAHNAAILFTPQYDAIEEVAIETGGLSAQVGNTAGNFINVVTKSGGNTFHGTLNGYYSSEKLVRSLFTDEQLAALRMGKPPAPIFSYDASASLGGPVIKDKVWFFFTLALEKSKDLGNFIPTVIDGRSYDQYDLPNQFLDGFLKLSAQLSPRLRLFMMGGYSDQDRPIDGSGARQTQEVRYSKDNNRRMTGTANLTWQLNSNAILDLRVGVSRFNYPIADTDLMDAGDGIGRSDGFTGYAWSYPQSWASDIRRTATQASARLTHFLDNVLGGNHELGAGLEYVKGQDYWALFRPNPLNWDYYNGNPYYYRGLYGLNEPHPVYGDGQLMFQIYPSDPAGCFTEPSKSGIGAYLQDNFTISNRLTISLGVRFDSVTGYIPAASHAAVDSDLALGIGDFYFMSQYGFNPFAENTTPAWEDAMKWTSVTPRVGVSYDLFGDGRTALKASYAEYAEALPVMYYQGNHPFSQSQWGWNPLRFRWFDDNQNGVPDGPPTDQYVLYAGNISDYDPDPATYMAKIDQDAKAPRYREYIFGVEHELLAQFRVGAKYFHRERRNAVDTVLFDRTTGRPWYTYEEAPDWWVPFTTQVPAYGIYPEQEVTVYFPSVNSPWNNRFNLFTNVPESKRKYDAVEFTFEKRYAAGWALGGSVVLSRTVGNNTGRAGSTHGFSGAYDNPNWFVNRYGRTDDDRPLAIKFFGSVDLPWGFLASFYATNFSGFPYQRTITIYPPSDWISENEAINIGGVGVLAEPAGTRRNSSRQNVDIRLEKEFLLGESMGLSAAVDVLNILGNSYVTSGLDPAGTWRPTTSGTNEGTYAVGFNYGKVNSITGVRIFKFNLRFRF